MDRGAWHDLMLFRRPGGGEGQRDDVGEMLLLESSWLGGGDSAFCDDLEKEKSSNMV